MTLGVPPLRVDDHGTKSTRSAYLIEVCIFHLGPLTFDHGKVLVFRGHLLVHVVTLEQIH